MHYDIDGRHHDTFRNMDTELGHGEGVGERLPNDVINFLNYWRKDVNNYSRGVRIFVS